MKSKMKPQPNELVQAIGEFAAAQQQLARQAEQQYSFDLTFKDTLKTNNKQTNLCSPYQNINPPATDLPTFP
jgi:hypothetical protein